MKIASYKLVNEVGFEFLLDLFTFKRYKAFSMNMTWDEYHGPFYLQVSSGIGSLLSVMVCIGKFGIDISLCRRNYANSSDKYWLDR